MLVGYMVFIGSSFFLIYGFPLEGRTVALTPLDIHVSTSDGTVTLELTHRNSRRSALIRHVGDRSIHRYSRCAGANASCINRHHDDYSPRIVFTTRSPPPGQNCHLIYRRPLGVLLILGQSEDSNRPTAIGATHGCKLLNRQIMVIDRANGTITR